MWCATIACYNMRIMVSIHMSECLWNNKKKRKAVNSVQVNNDMMRIFFLSKVPSTETSIALVCLLSSYGHPAARMIAQLSPLTRARSLQRSLIILRVQFTYFPPVV